MSDSSLSYYATTHEHRSRLQRGTVLAVASIAQFMVVLDVTIMRSRLDSRYRILDPDIPLQRPPSAYIGSNVVITTSGVFSTGKRSPTATPSASCGSEPIAFREPPRTGRSIT